MALVAAITLAGAARAATPLPPQAQEIVRGIWMIPGGMLPNRQPDGNTVIFVGKRGLVVVDTGRHPWHREAIRNFATREHMPIVAIVNSHWHLDHVSGNPDLKRTYPRARVYASGAINEALSGFLARSAAESRPYLESGKLPAETLEDLRADMATIDAGTLLLPDVVITASKTRYLAGRKLAVNLAPDAATAGDVWIYDPVTRVAAVGDLVTLPAPFLDTACPAGWSKALARVWATPFKIAIPGHGAPMSRAEFAIYRTAFDDLIACSASARDRKECAADWVKNAGDLLSAIQLDPRQAEGMADYYVGEVLRPHGGKSADCKTA